VGWDRLGCGRVGRFGLECASVGQGRLERERVGQWAGGYDGVLGQDGYTGNVFSKRHLLKTKASHKRAQ
jgi:hypothetical protein